MIQAQIGHVSPQMMKTYSHIRREALNQAGRGVGAVRVDTDNACVEASRRGLQ
jgi:hypothetical protein